MPEVGSINERATLRMLLRCALALEHIDGRLDRIAGALEQAEQRRTAIQRLAEELIGEQTDDSAYKTE